MDAGDIGYAIGYGLGLFVGLAGYAVAFVVLAEAIKRLFRRLK